MAQLQSSFCSILFNLRRKRGRYLPLRVGEGKSESFYQQGKTLSKLWLRRSLAAVAFVLGAAPVLGQSSATAV